MITDVTSRHWSRGNPVEAIYQKIYRIINVESSDLFYLVVVSNFYKFDLVLCVLYSKWSERHERDKKRQRDGKISLFNFFFSNSYGEKVNPDRILQLLQ